MGELTPPISQTKMGAAVDRGELADGEVTSDEVTTVMFSTLSRL